MKKLKFKTKDILCIDDIIKEVDDQGEIVYSINNSIIWMEVTK